MRWKMPNCALIGVLAVGLVVAYAAVTIFLDFSGAFNLPPIRLLYLIGGTLLLVGLLRRSKVAWKATVAAATVLEVVSAVRRRFSVVFHSGSGFIPLLCALGLVCRCIYVCTFVRASSPQLQRVLQLSILIHSPARKTGRGAGRTWAECS